MKPAAVLGVIPAMPLLALGVSSEYWGRIYVLWGVAFAAANCTSLTLMLSRRGCEPDCVPPTGRIFLRQVIAWCFSSVALGGINLTPLCLGQDNGDGRNGLAMCMMLTVVWSAFMSWFVLPLAYAASVGVRRAMRGGLRREDGLTRP